PIARYGALRHSPASSPTFAPLRAARPISVFTSDSGSAPERASWPEWVVDTDDSRLGSSSHAGTPPCAPRQEGAAGTDGWRSCAGAPAPGACVRLERALVRSGRPAPARNRLSGASPACKTHLQNE